MARDFRTRLARYIARRRQWGPVQAAHAVASYIEGAYENDEWDMAANGELDLLRRLAPARFTTALDVGAHVGGWAIAAARAWPAVFVHAFEVAPRTFDQLTRHVADAGLAARMALSDVGLSDAPGTREMYYFPDHPNLTCDRPRHSQYTSVPFTGRLTAGDRYVAQRALQTIDFLKIDVEGAEHLVLRGFRESLEDRRIQCIQFEYGAFSIQTRVLLADYYALLGRQYWIGKIYPTYVDFSDYDWRMENFRFSNYLCVLRDREDVRVLVNGS